MEQLNEKIKEIENIQEALWILGPQLKEIEERIKKLNSMKQEKLLQLMDLNNELLKC